MIFPDDRRESFQLIIPRQYYSDSKNRKRLERDRETKKTRDQYLLTLMENFSTKY